MKEEEVNWRGDGEEAEIKGEGVEEGIKENHQEPALT